MASRDAAKALAEGQRAARSATPQKLWPKANAQLGVRRRKSEAKGFAKPASRQSRPRSWRGIFSNKIDADQREAR